MFQEDILACIQAGVPAVAITTYEWERAAIEVNNIVKNVEGLQFGTWSFIDGLKIEGETVVEPGNALTPLTALETMENIVVVFYNYNSNFKNPAVQQKVRNSLLYCKNSGIMLVFISASGEMPIELEKEIILIDFALPDKKTIEAMVNKLVPASAEDHEIRIKLIDAALGLSYSEAENLISLSLAKNNIKITEQTVADVKRQKAQELKKTGVLELYEPENLPQVGGLEELKLWLYERGKAFSPEAREKKLPYPKGALVTGISGTGKSLIAKTISKEWGMPLLVMGNVMDKFVGESEKRIKNAWKQAEAMAPCVLMIDEIEKMFAGVGGGTDSGVTTRVFGILLTLMQESKDPVFVVATANRVDTLPPELLRKGRFDELWFVDLPGDKERKDIFAIHLAKWEKDVNSFDLERLSAATPGYTGSEIEQVVISGLYKAFSKGKELDTQLLCDAAKETAPLSVTMALQIQAMREWGKQRARLASLTQEEPEKKESLFTVERKFRSIYGLR